VNVAPLRPRAELACVHVLDHTLTQRADRNMPAIDDLSFGYCPLG
jgi:hypothetical protein